MRHDLEIAKPFVLMADAVITDRFPVLPEFDEMQLTFDIDKRTVVMLNKAQVIAVHELAERLRK